MMNEQISWGGTSTWERLLDKSKSGKRFPVIWYNNRIRSVVISIFRTY
jgi:hypothetical protein